MLLEKITPDDIQIGLVARDWEEAIRLGAAPLLENGAIEPSYIDAMIDSVHRNGPYYVLAKGLALSHARPEEGVNRMAIGFSTFDLPVYFHAGANDPVRLIITLASPDSNSHLDLLAELVAVLMDQERMEKLFAAKTPKEFCSILAGKEN